MVDFSNRRRHPEGRADLTAEEARFIDGVVGRVGGVMHGLETVAQALLAALLARGHVLLEGPPGLGKTRLSKEFSSALGLDPTRRRQGRIQFTPDLMPADIIGTEMPTREDRNRLAFEPGDVFHWVLLADEINRATAKTQAAMLQAMAETSVTNRGRVYDVRFRTAAEREAWRRPEPTPDPPFFVMATQNPIEQEGTFELPEAQSDRFMFKVRMPFPGAEDLSRILSGAKEGDRRARIEAAGIGAPGEGGEASEAAARYRIEPSELAAVQVMNAVEAIVLGRIRRFAAEAEELHRHVLNLVYATQRDYAALEFRGGGKGRAAEAEAAVVDALAEGAAGLGPRAATDLVAATAAWAVIDLGRHAAARGVDSVAPDDAGNYYAAFERVVLPVTRHRLRLRYAHEMLGPAARDAALWRLVRATSPSGSLAEAPPADVL